MESVSDHLLLPKASAETVADNVVQACALADSPAARGRGALFTLNDRITSGFYGIEHSANRLDTFT